VNTPDAAGGDLAFLGITLPSRAPCEATPAMAEDGRGFRIAAPRRVNAGDGVRLPICGVWQFGPERRELAFELWEACVLVLVDVTHNRARAVTLRDPSRTPVEPLPKPPDSDPGAGGRAAPSDGPVKRASLTAGYYNFDLTRFIPLPPAPAVYYVFLTQAQYHSNTVRVEAVAPPEEK
jgi:hypothetical protein